MTTLRDQRREPDVLLFTDVENGFPVAVNQTITVLDGRDVDDVAGGLPFFDVDVAAADVPDESLVFEFGEGRH